MSATSGAEWENLPSYFEVFDGYLRYVGDFAHRVQRGEYVFSRDGVQDVRNCLLGRVSSVHIAIVLACSVALTAARHALTQYLFKPVGRRLELLPRSLNKMPESAWKCLFFFSAWIYTAVIVYRRGYFQRPSTVWEGWSLDGPVPFDMQVLYVIECSFYIHSLYAITFLDEWRKDSSLQLIHHVIALLLLILSYYARSHNIGTFTLVFHDICDVFLEFSKLQVYFKIRKGRLIIIHQMLAVVGFVCFCVCWFAARLYWFPLKVLYAGSISVMEYQIVLPFGVMLITLLWVIHAMSVYWSTIIIRTIVRIATGQMDDPREYDVLEKIEKTVKEKKNSMKNGSVHPAENGAKACHENGNLVTNKWRSANLRTKSTNN